MKKYLAGVGLVVAVVAARPGRAQQLAQYSQYMNNNYLLNPAVAGTEDFIDVRLSHRTQWTGIEGAPRTEYITVNSALGALHTQPKRTLYDWRRGIHALGGLVYTDVTGPTRRTGAYVSYSYNLPLSKTVRLAMGASVGVQQFSLDGSQLQFFNPGTVVASQASRVPDANIGVWLYSDRFYAGASSAQLFGNQLTLTYDPNVRLLGNNRLERHYFLTGGVRLPLGEDVSLVPSVLVKLARPAPLSVDLNAKLKYRDVLWLGGSYRVMDAWVAMLGVNVSNLVSLSYSYDATASELAGYQGGSHEVLLGLKLRKKEKEVCSYRFW